MSTTSSKARTAKIWLTQTREKDAEMLYNCLSPKVECKGTVLQTQVCDIYIQPFVVSSSIFPLVSKLQ